VEADLAENGYQVMTDASEQVDKAGGGAQNMLSTNVEWIHSPPPPPPCVCMSIHHLNIVLLLLRASV